MNDAEHPAPAAALDRAAARRWAEQTIQRSELFGYIGPDELGHARAVLALLARVEELEAEVAGLRDDARRLDWLDGHLAAMIRRGDGRLAVTAGGAAPWHRAATARAAIDQALAAAGAAP